MIRKVVGVMVFVGFFVVLALVFGFGVTSGFVEMGYSLMVSIMIAVAIELGVALLAGSLIWAAGVMAEIEIEKEKNERGNK